MLKKFINRNNLSKIGFGIIFGITGTSIINYYNPIIFNYHANKDPKFAIKSIDNLTRNNQILNDSLAVRTTASATQYGKEFHDELSANGRKSIIAHPYDKQGSGVSVTVIYYNTQIDEYKILLMRKLNVRNDLKKGLKNEHSPIGGYTKGGGVTGSYIDEENFDREENRDKIEDEFLSTGKYEIKSDRTVRVEADKNYFSSMGAALNDYTKEEIKRNPYATLFDPKSVKSFLESTGTPYHRDYNLIDATIREFNEETGYNKDIVPRDVIVVNVVDNLGVNNIVDLHTVGVNTCIFLGQRENDPEIYDINYAGERKEGSFKANGSEIGHLEWARIDELNQEDGIISYNNIPLQMAYSTAVNNVIKHIRESDIKKSSKGKIESRESISAWTGENTKQFTEVGEEASKKHKINICFAEKIERPKAKEDPMIIYQACMNR